MLLFAQIIQNKLHIVRKDENYLKK